MAKSTTGFQTINISSIVGFWNDNVSRRGINRFLAAGGTWRGAAELAVKMINGWDTECGVPVVELIPADLVEQAKTERKEGLEACFRVEPFDLKVNGATVTIMPGDLGSAYRELYISKDQGIAPAYRQVNCFHRLWCMPLVNVLRTKIGMAPIIELTVEVREFENELARLMVNSRENEAKTDGFVPTSDLDKVFVARKIYENGGRENDIRKAFKDSTGQKLYAICRLNDLNPDLRIVDRIMQEQGSEGYIPFGPLNKEVLRQFAAKGTINLEKAGEVYPINLSEYLGAPQVIKPAAPQAAKAADIETRIQTRSRLLKHILSAVRMDKLDSLVLFNDFADELDAVFAKMVEKGLTPLVYIAPEKVKVRKD
jgi:hypothetical protein